MASRDRLFLIDGSALAYRAHFAFVRNPLRDSRGMVTSAVFGFARAMFKLYDDERPQHWAVVFDTPEPTFRHQSFAAYKAQRQAMPEELEQQFPLIHRLVEAMGVPLLAVPGFEADDLLATLARQAAARGLETVLFTADKDLMQLVGEDVRVLVPGRSGESPVWVDAAQVVERFGVPPERIVDLLALMGDASDNIPGVPGVGEKTAAKLLEKYGDLDAVLERGPKEEPGALAQKLASGQESARMSRELAQLRFDAPVEFAAETLRARPPETAELMRFLLEMGFHSLVESRSFPSAAPSARHRTVERAEDLDALAAGLRASGVFAVDTETTDQRPVWARLVGLSFSDREGEAWYVPVGHRAGPNVPIEEVRARLGPVLSDPSLCRVGQNAKYDLIVLRRAGFEVAPFGFDTMIASYLLDPSRRHNLDAMALDHLEVRKIPTSSLLGTGRTKRTMDEVPVADVAAYAGEDAEVTLRLMKRFGPALEARDQVRLMHDLEMPLLHVLADMETTGVAIDAEVLKSLSGEVGREMVTVAGRLYDLAGCEFNLNSPQQLAEVLFKRLGLKGRKRTKVGFSTDAEVLEELAEQHELPREMLRFRELSKLRSTYIDALPKLVHPETGRIHASWNQAVAETGRLSSSDPNLQNIPIRTPLGNRVREAFVPGRPGWLLLAADYSQIELRVLAHVSRDPSLVEAFERDVDVHALTASRLFEKPLEAVDAAMRARAKTVNFGVLYGMGPQRLAREFGLPLSEAKAFIDDYFAKMPGVKSYLERGLEEARKTGYVTSLLGRRRYVPDIDNPSGGRRAFAERIAANTPIQGSAADIIKVAMIRLAERLREGRFEARLILQVHDELVLELPAAEVEAVRALIIEVMEGAYPLSVPLRVRAASGLNWRETH
jgi:DNA polymerase-1